MPEEEKKTVDIDTSGPGAEIDIEEKKDEAVVEQPEQEKENVEQCTDKTYENEREPTLAEGGEVEKKEEKKDDDKLEDYSKGVQSRIAKLTRKMREAERREKAALDYAKAVEAKRVALEKRFEKTDADYLKKFETSIQTGLEAAQQELAAAIQSGDAEAQVKANKRIATLAFENAKLEQAKSNQPVAEQKPVTNLNQGGAVTAPQTDDPINMDPKAEAWASKNPWFGTDRAMTCLLYTSPSPRDGCRSRMPSSA